VALSIGWALAQTQPAQNQPGQTPPAPTKPTPTQPSSDANALTDAQKQAIDAAGKDLATKVAPVALKLATLAKDYDRNILAEKPDPALQKKLADEMADAVAQLVSAAIRARIQSVDELAKLLTPEQKKLLLAELDKPDANPDLAELTKKVLGDKKK